RRRAAGQRHEYPVGPEPGARVRAPADRHVVAGARVHRQAPLHGIPLVVLLDQAVRVRVEAPDTRDLTPAPGEPRAVAAALAGEGPVGALDAAPLVGDPLVDL